MGGLFIKIGLIVLFFGVMLGVGFYCRRHSESVEGFVLGGRSVGAWFTAFAYGTSYFSAVIMVGYSGQFGWKYGIASTWIGLGNALIGGLLPQALRQPEAEAGRGGDHLCVPDPLRRLPL